MPRGSAKIPKLLDLSDLHRAYPENRKIEAWGEARMAETGRRLAARLAGIPTIPVNHYPLVRDPTRNLRYPEFAQWCGTERTTDWPVIEAATVYGHVHIPWTTWYDGVPCEGVFVGYLWERRPRGQATPGPRQIFPTERHAK